MQERYCFGYIRKEIPLPTIINDINLLLFPYFSRISPISALHICSFEHDRTHSGLYGPN